MLNAPTQNNKEMTLFREKKLEQYSVKQVHRFSLSMNFKILLFYFKLSLIRKIAEIFDLQKAVQINRFKMECIMLTSRLPKMINQVKWGGCGTLSPPPPPPLWLSQWKGLLRAHFQVTFIKFCQFPPLCYCAMLILLFLVLTFALDILLKKRGTPIAPYILKKDIEKQTDYRGSQIRHPHHSK
ncbi:hypothetical protein EGR_10863 [Echinococcus granulosus]|uniref:Uncharacterized protein n=1 Tax=Echinococcus granulosus TaxID=6210 RepID=W6UL89_ECHGR|nr:hypothetical protein EGR_10863 [Echinococcus granulosus]EUB54279.1 hypothetical protein EGR_10863 [Echinococcus granulosus]